MTTFKILLLLVIVLAVKGQECPEENTFNTTAALYLSVPSVRALAGIVIATLPGYTYLGKNITIDVHVDLGGLLKLNIDSIIGTTVDLSKEATVFNVTDKSRTSLLGGITGWTTSLLLYYNVSALWGLIDMKGPANITLVEADALVKATFGTTNKGYLFTLNLGSATFNIKNLLVAAGKGYWFVDYLFNNFQFLIPYAVQGAMNTGISAASKALNDILQNSKPETTVIPVFPHSGIILKPLVSFVMDPVKETLTLRQLSAEVVDLKTNKSYYNRPISSQPIFLETIGIHNQIFISDNLLNSLLKAAAIDFPGMVMFNTSDDSVHKIMDELPEIGQVYGEHLDYLIKYGVTPDTQIVVTKDMVHLFGNISMIVYVKMDQDHVPPMVTFYSDVSLKMNMTISNYRMFVMIKDVQVHSTDYVVHDENLHFSETPEEMNSAILATLIEESSCLNGRFLLPYDLKKIQEIGYASKYLKDMTLRFDKLDNYFMLGFNAHEI